METGNADPVRLMLHWRLLSQRHLQQSQSQQKPIIERKSKILMTELRKLTIALTRRKVSLMRFLKRNINIDQDKMTKQLKEKMIHLLKQ